MWRSQSRRRSERREGGDVDTCTQFSSADLFRSPVIVAWEPTETICELGDDDVPLTREFLWAFGGTNKYEWSPVFPIGSHGMRGPYLAFEGRMPMIAYLPSLLLIFRGRDHVVPNATRGMFRRLYASLLRRYGPAPNTQGPVKPPSWVPNPEYRPLADMLTSSGLSG